MGPVRSEINIERVEPGSRRPNALNGNGGTNAAASPARDNRKRQSIDELGQVLVGESDAIGSIRDLVINVSETNANILIVGESGTGKELIAREIHRHSRRASGPFVSVNAGVIPQGAAERLMFGSEHGGNNEAFPTKGWCEQAEGGTLFLDELDGIDIQSQPRLLRLLHDGSWHRCGSEEWRRASVRMIAATNRDPIQLVASGRLREDLFFRLNVVPIYVPPLRDHVQDIPALAMKFLRGAAKRHERSVESISDDTLRQLQQYDWPGNIRELETVVERLVIFAREPVATAEDLPSGDCFADGQASRRFNVSWLAARQAGANGASMRLTPIERQEREAIVEALHRADGHVVGAVRLIGLGQATVYRKIKQYAIPHERKPRVTKPR